MFFISRYGPEIDLVDNNDVLLDMISLMSSVKTRLVKYTKLKSWLIIDEDNKEDATSSTLNVFELNEFESDWRQKLSKHYYNRFQKN